MSHASKVEFFAQARDAGYRTYLYFVATDSPDLSIHRIETRVKEGGHAVPREKVIKRYERSLSLVGDAASHAHRAFFFDNSGSEPIWIAQLTPQQQLELKIPESQLPS